MMVEWRSAIRDPRSGSENAENRDRILVPDHDFCIGKCDLGLFDQRIRLIGAAS